jgi:predicted DNA-binding transcriptional regulator AlpA
MAEQKFPAPVKLTERMVAWRSSELGQWCESRKRVSDS